MSTATFPLLFLPENVQRKVLNGFDAVQLINFSLLSNNAKQLVKYLNLTIYRICLYLDDVIFIRIIRDVEYQEGSIAWSLLPPRQIRGRRGTVPIYMPSSVKVMKRLHHGWLFEEIEEYQNPGLSISEWLKLFQEVFNHPPILDILLTKPDCLFNMKSIKDTVKGFNVDGLIFTHDCSMECAQLALKNFPEYGALFIDSPAFRNPVEYQDILIQNMESLTFGIFDHDEYLFG